MQLKPPECAQAHTCRYRIETAIRGAFQYIRDNETVQIHLFYNMLLVTMVRLCTLSPTQKMCSQLYPIPEPTQAVCEQLYPVDCSYSWTHFIDIVACYYIGSTLTAVYFLWCKILEGLKYTILELWAHQTWF